jgi:hypothetical protein
MAKFSSHNQPSQDKRSGGPRAGTLLLREAIDKKFASGDVEGFDNFNDWIVHRAVNEGGVYLRLVADRALPPNKPTFEPIKLCYLKDSTAVEKANAVFSAIVGGEVPADIGAMLIDSLAKMLAIEEHAELKQRIEILEKLLGNK